MRWQSRLVIHIVGWSRGDRVRCVNTRRARGHGICIDRLILAPGDAEMRVDTWRSVSIGSKLGAISASYV